MIKSHGGKQDVSTGSLIRKDGILMDNFLIDCEFHNLSQKDKRNGQMMEKG